MTALPSCHLSLVSCLLSLSFSLQKKKNRLRLYLPPGEKFLFFFVFSATGVGFSLALSLPVFYSLSCISFPFYLFPSYFFMSRFLFSSLLFSHPFLPLSPPPRCFLLPLPDSQRRLSETHGISRPTGEFPRVVRPLINKSCFCWTSGRSNFPVGSGIIS